MTIAFEQRNEDREEPRDAAILRLLRQVRYAEARADQLIAEREQLIEALLAVEEHHDHYVDLFALSPIPSLLLDAHGTVSELNSAAIRLFGFERRELIGMGFSKLVDQSERQSFAAHLIECPHAPLHVTWHGKATNANSQTLSLRVFTRRLDRDAGGFALTLVDMAELEAAEVERERLAAAEHESTAANQAKNHFIAVLSHELRTPLTPVLAAVSSFAGREDLSTEVRETFSMVQRNVTTEARLIDDLLDVTRIAHGKLSVELMPLDVHELVRDALQTLTSDIRGKSLDLEVTLESSRSWAKADPVRLRQVFWNLLRNAIKFTPPRGSISVRSWNAGNALVVEVSDTGCGIDPDSLPHLFEPFEQAPSPFGGAIRGLGLGLAICRGILDLHGAEIRAASAGPGKGARFAVKLEAVEPAAATVVEPQPSSSPPPPGTLRVLLVEDHEDTADILERLLKRSGYEVQVAFSVQSALQVERSSYDILISDIGLGDGTGHELMRALRLGGKVKGIALSGFGTESDVRASKEAGFAAHVTKPVNLPDLLQAITRLHTRAGA